MLRVPRFPAVVVVVAAAQLGVFAALCPAAEAKRPNVVWIMMDDCRADAVGCYGRAWARTPAMDALARRGVRFQTAIVQNPVCVPSRASMKTSQYAHALGIMAMGRPAKVAPPYLDKSPQTFPNLLNLWKQAGIAPVNAGKSHAFRKDWIHKGDPRAAIAVSGGARSPQIAERMKQFAATNPYPAVKTKTHHWQIGGAVPLKPQETSTWRLGDLAVETLQQLAARNEPFFLRASFHAPHVPCRVPLSCMIDPDTISLPLPSEEELKSKPRFERECLRVYAGGLDLTPEQIKIARGTYYGMVSLVDVQVGRIVKVLEKAGVLDNTIIAINSDQGFQLGEHGLWKKRVFYEQNVCVPFILSCPAKLPSGKVVEEPVEMVDFLPTLLELCELDTPGGIAGQSLLPLIRGRPGPRRAACFSEIDHARSMYDELRQGSGRRVMVRTRQWKMVFFMDRRVADKDACLYDLESDPGETENLYGKSEHAAVVERLERLAREWSGKS